MTHFDPGDIVVHDEYGMGTVKEHPDAPGDDYSNDPRNDTHVQFDDQPTTTLSRVRDHNLRKPTVAEAAEATGYNPPESDPRDDRYPPRKP